MNMRGVALAALLAVGCSVSIGGQDTFPTRLNAGCSEIEYCEALYSEAAQRSERCASCAEETRDLARATSLLNGSRSRAAQSEQLAASERQRQAARIASMESRLREAEQLAASEAEHRREAERAIANMRESKPEEVPEPASRVARSQSKQSQQPAEDKPIRMLRCRDGSTSQSCECGGPRRGCCSHHGGVAGCE